MKPLKVAVQKGNKKQSSSRPAAAPAPVRDPALDEVIAQINKKFGANALMRGDEMQRQAVKIERYARIRTGNITLDYALGGGIPRGRITHICGDYSTMKSTLSCHIIAHAQKEGLRCAYEDAEGTTDPEYQASLGVDTLNLAYARPEGLEECTQSILDMQRGGIINLAVYDSLEATPPMKEYESDMADTVRMGIKQQLLGEFFRKYMANNNRLVREGKPPFTLVVLNQLREKIGAYGDPEYSPGGRAKDFAMAVNLRLRKGDWITEGSGDNKVTVGQVVKFKVEKNKAGTRMRTGEFDFYFSENGAGIKKGYTDNFKSVILEAIDTGIVIKKGGWYYYTINGTDQKAQGLEALITVLRHNPEIVADFEKRLLQ